MFKKVLMSLILAMVLSTGVVYAMDKVNINTATPSELETLNGIGEKTAAAIIQYREENGTFQSVKDLVNVKGIGTKILIKVIDSVTVSEIE